MVSKSRRDSVGGGVVVVSTMNFPVMGPFYIFSLSRKIHGSATASVSVFITRKHVEGIESMYSELLR